MRRENSDLENVLIFTLAVIYCILFSACGKNKMPEQVQIQLIPWDRGIRVESKEDTTKFTYLWFYEWHLFDAIDKGEHTRGRWDWRWRVDPAQQTARLDADGLKLNLDATASGVDMLLEISNNSDHDWPAIAAVIPCFNPGTDRGKVTNAVANPFFFDDTYENTWFLSDRGFQLIKGEEYPREIHFSETLLPEVMTWKKEHKESVFVFSDKWPTSERSASAGLIIRESEDHQWVMGIAWDDFLSVQGHNPWKCMHLSVRVGPLKQGERKIIHGKIYLFQGSKEDCLKIYQQDFAEK